MSEQSSTELVVNPRTGEYLGDAIALEAIGTDILSECYLELAEHEKHMREMRKLVDHELVRRMDAAERKRLITDNFELHLETRSESVWDADELEQTLRDLIDEGTIHAAEVTGVVTHTTTVSRRAADKIAKQLSGESHRRVEACRRWRKAGTRRLEVIRAVSLLDPPQS